MARRVWPQNESDMGPPVEQWLVEQAFEVYHEVDYRDGRPDLVGVRGPIVCAIELKLSFGLDVLAQARRKLQSANLVWVAVPSVHRDYSIRALLREVAAWKGIGILTVGSYGYHDRFLVKEELEPEFRRKVMPFLRNAIRPEHKEYARAGSSRGGHFTPFKGTCGRVKRYIDEHPGATMKQLLAEVETHYASSASARSNLVAMIEKGIVPGVRLERDGKQWRLYPSVAT